MSAVINTGRTSIIKLAVVPAITGRITGNKESSYRKEIDSLTQRRTQNNLLFNINKLKRLLLMVIVKFGKKEAKKTHPCPHTSSASWKS